MAIVSNTKGNNLLSKLIAEILEGVIGARKKTSQMIWQVENKVTVYVKNLKHL